MLVSGRFLTDPAKQDTSIVFEGLEGDRHISVHDDGQLQPQSPIPKYPSAKISLSDFVVIGLRLSITASCFSLILGFEVQCQWKDT